MPRGIKRRRLMSNGTFCFTHSKGKRVPENVQQIVFDNSISEIPMMLCYEQIYLTRVFLPLGIRVIRANAFEECISLEKVAMPTTLNIIKEFAFANCHSLREVSMRETVCTIERGAFYACKSLTTIEIPCRLDELGDSVFENCISLSTVKFNKNGRLEKIGSRAFSDSGVQDIDIPSTVTSIGNQAFEECHSLKSARLYEGIKSIGCSAFAECSRLKTIDIPLSVMTIGDHAFSRCRQLELVLFPQWEPPKHPPWQKEIGHGAFSKCESLFNIYIPYSAYNVQKDCFEGCPLLEEHFGSKRIVWAIQNRFDGCPVHELFYHSSFKPETAMWELTEGDGKSFENVDPLGMTPFHVLFSCARVLCTWHDAEDVNKAADLTDLLQQILANCPKYIHGRKDKFGRLAIDYLEKGFMDEPLRDLCYELVLRSWTIERLEDWGKKEWLQGMAVALDRALPYKDRIHLSRTTEAITMYETIESVSLVELWLWKMQILVTRKQTFFLRERVSRKSCRNKCGADFIIPTVMEFLGAEKEYCMYYTSDEEESEYSDFSW